MTLANPPEALPTQIPLIASNQMQLEWPLAKEQRAHIHRIPDDHDLPVSHTTRRRLGRPYTLVLGKTYALFERAAAERRGLAARPDLVEKDRAGVSSR